MTLHKGELLGLLAGQPPSPLRHTGDISVLARLVSVFDEPDASFAIVARLIVEGKKPPGAP